MFSHVYLTKRSNQADFVSDNYIFFLPEQLCEDVFKFFMCNMMLRNRNCKNASALAIMMIITSGLHFPRLPLHRKTDRLEPTESKRSLKLAFVLKFSGTYISVFRF